MGSDIDTGKSEWWGVILTQETDRWGVLLTQETDQWGVILTQESDFFFFFSAGMDTFQ